MSLRKIAPLLVLVFAVQIGLPRNANAQSATDIVIEWNRILQATLAIPGALPPTIFVTRPFAILHVAMFDALNSIDYVYRPYAVRARRSSAALARGGRRARCARCDGVDVPRSGRDVRRRAGRAVARFPGDPGVQGTTSAPWHHKPSLPPSQ